MALLREDALLIRVPLELATMVHVQQSLVILPLRGIGPPHPVASRPLLKVIEDCLGRLEGVIRAREVDHVFEVDEIEEVEESTQLNPEK